MKTNHVLVALAVVLLAAPGARLLAQSGAADDLTLVFRKMNLDLMEKRISEASAREEARQLDLLLAAATYDVNKDGKLDAGEFAAWEKQVRLVAEKAPRILKEFDRNHDRKLDDAEWAAARKKVMPD